MERKTYIFRNARTGNELTDDQRQQIRKRAREGMHLASESPEFAKYLEKIDFQLLNSIIRKLFAKCGMNDTNRLNLNAQNVYQESQYLGSYNKEADAICVNFEDIKKYALNDQARNIVVLRAIVHEYLHSLGYIEINYNVDRDKLDHARIGLFQIEPGNADFEILEEGFNEILVRRIMDEYIVASGDISLSKYQEINTEQIDKTKELSSNVKATRIVQKLIVFIAQEVGISEETVFGALVREKLTGENSLHIWRQIFVDLLGEEKGQKLNYLFGTALYATSSKELEREISKYVKSDATGFIARAAKILRNIF